MKIIKTLLLAALPLLLQLVHATLSSTATGFIAGTGFTITGASFGDGNTFMMITVTTMLTGGFFRNRCRPRYPNGASGWHV